MKIILLRCAVSIGLLVLATAFDVTVAKAQPYNPGDKIEYKAQNWPEKWETGTFVRDIPGGRQVLIRETPTQFYPDGFQRAYALNDVRSAGSAPPAPNQPQQAQVAPARPPVTPQAGRPPKAEPAPRAEPAPAIEPAPRAGGGGGIMSEQDVLGVLNQLGNNPWGPNRAQVINDLAGQVKARGVSFRYSQSTPFYQQIAKYGATSEITFPLGDNFGPPPSRGSLLGAWRMEINAPATYFTKGNEVWRRNATVQKTGGTLTINADSSYSWSLSTGQVVQGRWRNATDAEMKTAGGEGLVLQRGRGGQDWIVTKYRLESPPNMSANWITVAEITSRQEREFGNR